MVNFPFSEALQVSHPGPAPQSSDVVIIGGGVIGVATALFLAERGVAVTLLEKGRIAAEQSSRNWGWIRKQGRDAAELPVVIEAGHIWKRWATEAGEDFGLRQGGVVYLAKTEKEAAGFARFMKLAGDYQLDTRLLTAQETAETIPGMARQPFAAMITPSDLRAEPWAAVPALARLAARKGVVIVENCAVRSLDIQAGQIAGVWTEDGLIRTSSVLVAAGAWSSLFLRNHDVSIPQLSVRATVAATEPMPEVFAGAAAEDQIAFRRRQDGGYTLAAGGANSLYVGPDAFRNMPKYLPALAAHPFSMRYLPVAPRNYPDAWTTARKWSGDQESPFERMRVLNPAPTDSAIKAIETGFGSLFPQLGPVRLIKTWAGMIDTMPEFVPIIDRAPKIAGLFIATGMSGHGFGIGPGVGRVVSDMILGNDPGLDLSRFRYSRFSDGSKLDLGPFI